MPEFCPHCECEYGKEGSHDEKVEGCPVTGKPLEQSGNNAQSPVPNSDLHENGKGKFTFPGIGAFGGALLVGVLYLSVIAVFAFLLFHIAVTAGRESSMFMHITVLGLLVVAGIAKAVRSITTEEFREQMAIAFSVILTVLILVSFTTIIYNLFFMLF